MTISRNEKNFSKHSQNSPNISNSIASYDAWMLELFRCSVYRETPSRSSSTTNLETFHNAQASSIATTLAQSYRQEDTTILKHLEASGKTETIN